MPKITLPTALQAAEMRTYTDSNGYHSQTTVPVELLPVTTGTLAAVNATVNTDITDAASVSVVITGTLSMTIAFEVSIDGTTWVPINLVNSSTMIAGTSTGAITAGNIGFSGSVVGWRKFRVKASAFVSGSATVSISPAGASASSMVSALLPQFTPTNPLPVKQDSSGLSVTATSTAGAAVTLTLPAAGSGLYHYIDAIEINLYNTAARTGSATPISVTSTNIPGAPSWIFPTAGNIGEIERYNQSATYRIKSTAANTASTLVCPAVTGGLWKATVVYATGA
ncbi:hypothetical protein [Thiothrix nivea]|uniref:Uncharacterized protein n=1 Tax=Thiothrix nivea (strain ATCC 35100 / DSM 5205 / JP2) TaxID=870187 RepID=A0A656HE56_THINJ|nr:hypothetical protein [Thiothrix nivea]EIJ33315.1 hypothetical protein Thini_0678 [Thiothrix nivea DSM 5205]